MNEFEVLVLVFEVEKNEFKFYLKFVRKIIDERVRKMFFFLVKEEVEYWDFFEEKFVERFIEKCEFFFVDKEFV